MIKSLKDGDICMTVADLYHPLDVDKKYPMEAGTIILMRIDEYGELEGVDEEGYGHYFGEGTLEKISEL